MVNNDEEFENPTANNITTTNVVSNRYALTESKDLVSLAIDESGLEQNQNWTLPKIFGGTKTPDDSNDSQDHQLEYTGNHALTIRQQLEAGLNMRQ